LSTVTPNFNWPVPTSTDLVKDGATAIEALGDSIDASLVDLKGGTSGQVLSKNSNTDMDFVWVTSDDANAIQNTIVDAKGDLIAATANDTPARLAVGTNGQVLTADSTAATGLAWATASGGSTNVAGKNGVLNSQFNVWQRGTSVASGNSYGADRWQQARQASVAGLTVSRQATGDTTNLPFIQYCARVQRDSGNTSTNGIYFGQPFETLNSLQYAGKTVTMSFYARKGANYSPTSSNLNVFLETGTGTDQNAIAGSYTGSAKPINQTITLTTTWQRFSYSATLGSTITEVMPWFEAIPTGTAGAADYYEITGVQVEIAGSASAYSPNTSTYQSELAACQRYYVRQTAALNNASIFGNSGYINSTTNAEVFVNLPVTMRTQPSSVDYSTIRIIDMNNSAYTISSAVISAASTQNIAYISATISGGNINRYVWLQAALSTSAYIGFSAEL
jgi:hypothetical protein